MTFTLVARQIAVVDTHGVHLMWCDEETAHSLLVTRKARLVRKNGHDRMLVATVAVTEFGSLTAGRGTVFDKTRYSHNHQTAENPEKVWTLKWLGNTRAIFTAVLDECLAA